MREREKPLREQADPRAGTVKSNPKAHTERERESRLYRGIQRRRDKAKRGMR